MKSLMILGSIVGFVVGASFALASQSSWPTSLWRASAAALAGALLIRWWGRMWINGLRDSLQQRRYARPSTPATKPNNKI
ncbi:MAG TPA: hypothetical protein VEH04_00315 [Verrucomicrobiae bacterium]|nr:hypothetical protein [Verrucomicrobiae bacterium]